MNRILDLVKNDLVCIYVDKENPEKFWLGFIIGYDNQFLLLERVDGGGRSDGISVIKTSEIYAVETRNAYTNKFRGVAERIFEMELFNHEGVMQEFMNCLIVENEMVCIETNNSDCADVTGIVKEVIDGWICVEAYDGEIRDGIAYCRLENITSIDIMETL